MYPTETLFNDLLAIETHPLVDMRQTLPMVQRRLERVRLLQALYLESISGLSATAELCTLMASVLGQHKESQNIRKAFYESLPRSGLVLADSVSYIRGSEFCFQTLSSFGFELVQALEWPVVESEAARINRLHQGERMRRHAAGMIAFAHQARLRNWRASILPEMKRRGVIPDLSIHRDGSDPVYVEIESRYRGKDDKWKRNFERQGYVAIVGFTPGVANAYMAECVDLSIPALVGDLQSMIMGPAPSQSLFQRSSGYLPRHAERLMNG